MACDRNIAAASIILKRAESQEDAERLAMSSPEDFFEMKLQETYPELGREAAKNLVELNPNKFFRIKLQEIYPELERVSAENLAKSEPRWFFHYKLEKTHPDLGRATAENLAKSDPNRFFWIRLQEIYPELADMATENLVKTDLYLFLMRSKPEWFFERKLQETYPEPGKILAGNLAKSDPNKFFEFGLQKDYPELGRVPAENLAKSDSSEFFNLQLNKIYPEIAITIATSLPGDLKDKFVLEEDAKSDNFISITKSKFQDTQRHPRARGLERYDFAINSPLVTPEDDVASQTLGSMYRQALGEAHAVGIQGNTKSFALISFDDAGRAVIVEELQSDLPLALNSIMADKDLLIDRYGEQAYYHFVQDAADHAAKHPYMLIEKLARFSQDNNISKIKISDVDVAEIYFEMLNKAKRERIYKTIPEKLGFRHEGTFMVYDGDMSTLQSRARQFYEKIETRKPISKRKKETAVKLINMQAIRSELQEILGARFGKLNLSNQLPEFMKSINILNKQGVITNGEKNKIFKLVMKNVLANIERFMVKNGEWRRKVKISKRAF